MMGLAENILNAIVCFWFARMPLYLGMLGIGVNVVIIIYESMLSWSMRRFDEKWELWSISALPFITLLGIISFCL